MPINLGEWEVGNFYYRGQILLYAWENPSVEELNHPGGSHTTLGTILGFSINT